MLKKAILILLCLIFATPALARDWLSCWHEDKVDGLRGLERCAWREGVRLRVAPAFMHRTRFDRDGLGALAIAGQWYYVKRDGRMLPVVSFDNGPDYFEEGLTRSLQPGGMAWYDRNFRQVIAPRYDWGSPFHKGRAEVCRGCVESAPDGDGHRSMVGGEWGVIDRSGREVEPLKGSPPGAGPAGNPFPVPASR